jgi:(2Fe-2S) ferredoxin
MSEPVQRYLVTVCQHRSCLRNGSAAVLAQLQAHQSDTLHVSACECQGQCGSGPTVRVMPGNTWYCQVKPADIDRIVTEHLQPEGQPVEALLNPRLHPPRSAYANMAAQYQTFLQGD